MTDYRHQHFHFSLAIHHHELTPLLLSESCLTIVHMGTDSDSAAMAGDIFPRKNTQKFFRRFVIVNGYQSQIRKRIRNYEATHCIRAAAVFAVKLARYLHCIITASFKEFCGAAFRSE